MNPEDYITDETEQANPGEQLKYAELVLGVTTLQFKSEVSVMEPTGYELITWLRDSDSLRDYTIFKNKSTLAPHEAERILESYGPWDYTE